MPTLDNHFDDGTGRPKLLSPDKRDDASIIDRNTKIEDMRKRVEKQLAALVAGNDLNALQQQVAELRTTTPSTTPKASFDDTFGFNSSVADGLTMEGKDLLSSHGIPDLPEDTATSTYVDDIDMTDPYGDQGVFTGEVAASTNKPNGLGTMRYVDGRTFSGGWNQGQWHGKGTAMFANGDKFDGRYDLDRRHGFGVYEWRDGRVYEGEFRHDQRQGCGEYRWPDGAIYRGEFKGGHRHGEGTYTFSDRSTYTGEWLKGRYHGVGQCVWKDGRVYKGEWKEGKAHGYGVEKRSNGTIRHEGVWDKDNPVRKR